MLCHLTCAVRLLEVVRLYERGKAKADAEHAALKQEIRTLAEELRRIEVGLTSYYMRS